MRLRSHPPEACVGIGEVVVQGRVVEFEQLRKYKVEVGLAQAQRKRAFAFADRGRQGEVALYKHDCHGAGESRVGELSAVGLESAAGKVLFRGVETVGSEAVVFIKAGLNVL